MPITQLEIRLLLRPLTELLQPCASEDVDEDCSNMKAQMDAALAKFDRDHAAAVVPSCSDSAHLTPPPLARLLAECTTVSHGVVDPLPLLRKTLAELTEHARSSESGQQGEELPSNSSCCQLLVTFCEEHLLLRPDAVAARDREDGEGLSQFDHRRHRQRSCDLQVQLRLSLASLRSEVARASRPSGRGRPRPHDPLGSARP